MTSIDRFTAAALENQAFALMSRLHVILRRERGRITDIEYMRINPDYCRHVLAFATDAGLDSNSDAARICERLQEIYFGSGGLFVAPPLPPLLERLSGATGHTEPAARSRQSRSGMPAAEPVPEVPARVAKTAYIGRLR